VQQITTGDTNAVKNLLDDMAINYVIDKAGYKEDKKPGDLKLVLMVASVSVACVAQFLEKIDTSWEFPKNRALLFVCCSLYFIMSLILQYILSFVDFDIIHYSVAKDSKPVKDCGLTMRTRFPRFSEFFTVMFEWSDA
jgi:hypothetical protein